MQQNPDFQYDVFLSYSSKDQRRVRQLAERLSADGLRVWFDAEEIKAGDIIGARIEAGLETSRVLVLCMSANADVSDWARLEAGTFRFRDPVNREKKFIPLRLDDYPFPNAIAQFAYIDWRDCLAEAKLKEEYAKLLHACSHPTQAKTSLLPSNPTRNSMPAQRSPAPSDQPGQMERSNALCLPPHKHKQNALVHSYHFMQYRDELLQECEEIKQRIEVDRIRLYRFVQPEEASELFQGVVQIGGMFANFQRFQLPIVADPYSEMTLIKNTHGVPILYSPSGDPTAPPLYRPANFWRDNQPKVWADILLKEGDQVVGKLSIDNQNDSARPLPGDIDVCRVQIKGLTNLLLRGPDNKSSVPSDEETLSAHKRRLLLNDWIYGGFSG